MDKLLSRRDFLKAAALGTLIGGATVLAPKAVQVAQSIDEGLKLAYGEDNFLSDPTVWQGKDGEKLVNIVGDKIFNLYSEVYPLVTKDSEGSAPFNKDRIQGNVKELMLNVATRGLECSIAKLENMDNIAESLMVRYYELSSYANMLLSLEKYREKIGNQEFIKQLNESNVDEDLSNFRDSIFEDSVKRREILAVWNYDIRGMVLGNEVSNPIASSLFYEDAFGMEPYLFSGDRPISGTSLKPPIGDNLNGPSKERPREVNIVDFDNEVSGLIRDELQTLGIDRATNELQLVYDYDLWATTNQDNDKTNIFYPKSNTLTKSEYLSREREILHVIVHEVWHSISSRRGYLTTEDRLKVRDLELSILKSADPLSSLKTIFGAKGRNHGDYEDNEFSVTRYFLRSVCDYYQHMPESAVDIYAEFSTALKALTKEDLSESIQISEKDDSIQGMVDRIKNEISGYKGGTKFMASLLLEAADDINSDFLENYKSEKFLFPLIFSHAILYRFDDFSRACGLKPESKNGAIMNNYMKTLQKRFKTFVQDDASEEFLAEIFAESLLTQKYGKHDVSFVNKAQPIFKEIVEIMKSNGLATEFNTSRFLSDKA